MPRPMPESNRAPWPAAETPETPETSELADALVLGAGMSGLAAARALLRAGRRAGGGGAGRWCSKRASGRGE
jgi:cation diffusion facilitator CzcD-associated flavoprotein CzcO